MSPRYRVFADPEQMVRHISLFERLENNNFVWEVEQTNGDTRTVTVCAKDRPGLFSSIAGCFTLNNVNILNAQVFTWRNNTALDIFVVKPPPDPIFEDQRWEKAEKSLNQILEDRLKLEDVLNARREKSGKAAPAVFTKPNQVLIDTDTSSFFTIIEVYTYDRAGLLFAITNALFKSGLDIWASMISTRADQVVDVFYVRDF